MVKKVGFIGLGDIGLPMAKCVVKGGYEVTVCAHIRRQPVEEMKSSGAKEAKTAKAVAEASEVTITMLRDDVDTGEVVLGANGVMEGAKEGSGIILMSTLSPAFCRRVGEVAKAKNVGVLDAPVTGARMRAATGQLAIMVGGDRKLMERYRPILETMGTITYCGDLGMGEIVKLANNMALTITTHGVYEAVSWGIKNGADEDLLVSLMKMGTANSWTVQNWEHIKSIQVEPQPAMLRLGIKDIDYILKIAHEVEQPCPLLALCRERWTGEVLKLPRKS
jgi:2-hydroxy-3-oxopropionate reductase